MLVVPERGGREHNARPRKKLINTQVGVPKETKVPEDQIIYHPHWHVWKFIHEGREKIGRKEEENREGREAVKRMRKRRREEGRRKSSRKTEEQRKGEQRRIEEKWRLLRRARELEYLKDCQEAGFKLKKDKNKINKVRIGCIVRV